MADSIKVIEVKMVRRIPQVRHICPVCGEQFTASERATYCPRPKNCKTVAGWRRYLQRKQEAAAVG